MTRAVCASLSFWHTGPGVGHVAPVTFFSADTLPDPKMPSMAPTYTPWSFRACWTILALPHRGLLGWIWSGSMRPREAHAGSAHPRPE